MNFSVSSLFAGILFSAIGLFLFREGKRRGNLMIAGIGAVLFIFTYFTPNAAADWIIGTGLCGGAYFIWKKNY